MVRRIALTVLGSLALAGAAQAADAPVTEDMRACAMFGPKRPGDASTRAMGDLIERRFAAAGLDTRTESFHLPSSRVRSVIAQETAPVSRTIPATAFAYTGSGHVDAGVIYVGSGRAQDYSGLDARGKIVMVERDELFHRSSQLNEVVAQGGKAMLYVSGSPDNLVQIGAVRFAQDVPSPIPTVTVGAADGAPLIEAARAGTLKMQLTVDADRIDVTGRNIIGVQRGSTYPDRYVVVGAHYDSWYAGAVDNCSAAATLLQLADASRDLKPAYSVIYAGWDAEEVGLTGSADFVRRHPDIVARTVVNQNLEMDAAAADGSSVNLAFGSTSPTLNALVTAAGLSSGFVAVSAPATAVRAISGGIIPTDLQEFYARGVQGVSTYASTPYYHTTQDTPDKINPVGHVGVTRFSQALLGQLQSAPPEAFSAREVPTVDIDAPTRARAGEPFVAKATLRYQLGTGVTGAPAYGVIQFHDWWPVYAGAMKEEGNGVYALAVPAGVLLENGEYHVQVYSRDTGYAAENWRAFEVVGGTPSRTPGTIDRPAAARLRITGARLLAGRRGVRVTLSRTARVRAVVRHRGRTLASRTVRARSFTIRRARPLPRTGLTVRVRSGAVEISRRIGT